MVVWMVWLCGTEITAECLCALDAPEVQIWTHHHDPSVVQTYISTIC